MKEKIPELHTLRREMYEWIHDFNVKGENPRDALCRYPSLEALQDITGNFSKETILEYARGLNEQDKEKGRESFYKQGKWTIEVPRERYGELHRLLNNLQSEKKISKFVWKHSNIKKHPHEKTTDTEQVNFWLVKQGYRTVLAVVYLPDFDDEERILEMGRTIKPFAQLERKGGDEFYKDCGKYIYFKPCIYEALMMNTKIAQYMGLEGTSTLYC